MHVELDDFRNEEILHFIGNAKGEPDKLMLSDIELMKQKVISLASPRVVYREFVWKNGVVEGIHFELTGTDIQQLLKESHHCIFMAVTLGNAIDKEMRKLQLMDMGKALIFDCCASAAIEHICDQVQANLKIEYETMHQYLTDRYSCGYGDLSVLIQDDFLKVLEAQKKIGLYVNDSSILHPMKSVTAIIGVANKLQPAILRGCAYCLLRGQCEYRKGGTLCGK